MHYVRLCYHSMLGYYFCPLGLLVHGLLGCPRVAGLLRCTGCSSTGSTTPTTPTPTPTPTHFTALSLIHALPLIHSLVHLFAGPSVCWSICLLVHLFAGPSVCWSICLLVHLFAGPSVCWSICLLVHLFAGPSV